MMLFNIIYHTITSVDISYSLQECRTVPVW